MVTLEFVPADMAASLLPLTSVYPSFSITSFPGHREVLPVIVLLMATSPLETSQVAARAGKTMLAHSAGDRPMDEILFIFYAYVFSLFRAGIRGKAYLSANTFVLFLGLRIAQNPWHFNPLSANFGQMKTFAERYTFLQKP